MNLEETYPEIEDFFEKDCFSESDINMLIIDLTKKYNKKDLIKARDIFELKLLSYNLKKEEEKSLKDINKVKITNYLSKIEKKQRRKGKTKKFLRIKKAKREYKESLKQGNTWIKEMYASKKKALQRQEKNKSHSKTFESPIKRSNQSYDSDVREEMAKYQSNGVWDKIAKYGPGKIIYIRSR